MNNQLKTIVLTLSVNYFGDDVVCFPGDDGKTYNMWQYNCSGAHDLLRDVKALTQQGYVVLVDESDWMNSVHLVSAIAYVERIIKLNNDVAELERTNGVSFAANNCAGAEIAGHYGY